MLDLLVASLRAVAEYFVAFLVKHWFQTHGLVGDRRASHPVQLRLSRNAQIWRSRQMRAREKPMQQRS